MYSRDNPSPTFKELERVYASVHSEGLSGSGAGAAELFDGRSLRGHIEDIRDLSRETGAKTILDYGSGKGKHYRENSIRLGPKKTIPAIRTYWQVDDIVCYDPGVEEYAVLPERGFDGVISTDVLEHIPQDDIPWVLGEMFSRADRFLYANIAGYPARKTLPNGWNAHVTVKDPSWWRERIDEAARGWRGQRYVFTYERRTSGIVRAVRQLAGKTRYVKSVIASR